MVFKKALLSLINKVPYVQKLAKENADFRQNACYPAGHYYSPIVSVDELRRREDAIWPQKVSQEIPGINLQIDNQLALVGVLSKYYDQIPFRSEKVINLRYNFRNRFYSYTDGVILYSIIRHYKPKRIIEIGSGFTSALMLDTNELFFKNEIDMLFIEPYPERLFTLMKESDKDRVRVIQDNVQNVSVDVFDRLQSGDILFVDSSHIVKTGSDVNHILFNIVPRLQTGVIMHFHDIFYPFEYPKDWVYGGRNWNEAYFLKSFLMYNTNFEILFFSDFIKRFYKDALSVMPLCYNGSGGNLWLKKN